MSKATIPYQKQLPHHRDHHDHDHQHQHDLRSTPPHSPMNDDSSSSSPIPTSSNRNHPSFTDHLGKQRQYWRDIILGINDGLVSTFLLVLGVSGSNLLSSHEILITAISGSIAGSISMFAGEYIATKSQDDVLTGEINLENHHIQEYRAEEIQELPHLLSLIGIPMAKTTTPSSCCHDELRNELMKFYSTHPEALLKVSNKKDVYVHYTIIAVYNESSSLFFFQNINHFTC